VLSARHLQRVLDALPSGSQVPPTDVNAQSIPVVSDKVQRSNIVSKSVSPGILVSRADVVAPLLADDSVATLGHDVALPNKGIWCSKFCMLSGL
jgi:hypothetical protein